MPLPIMNFDDTLRFSPFAFAKLMYMQKKGHTEVAGYGVTGTDNPLLVTDFVLIKQTCTDTHFEMDTNDIADYMDRMLDAGLDPWQSSNLLLHTHPGTSPNPSLNDEDNFRESFSSPHWAIMFIIADNGSMFCRLKANVGPGVTKNLKIDIDWNIPFNGSDYEAWDKEYKAKVAELTFGKTPKVGNKDTVKKECPHEYDPLLQLQDCSESLENIECYWETNGHASYHDYETGEWYSYDPVSKQWYKCDDDDNEVKIATPDKEWASHVTQWANKYSDATGIPTPR